MKRRPESAISLNLLPRHFHSVSPHQDTSAHLLCHQPAYRLETHWTPLLLSPLKVATAAMWCVSSWCREVMSSHLLQKEEASCFTLFSFYVCQTLCVSEGCVCRPHFKRSSGYTHTATQLKWGWCVWSVTRQLQETFKETIAARSVDFVFIFS